MSNDLIYLVAADALLALHTLFVAFVVLGLVAVYVGYRFSWAWVRNFWFRITHLLAIGFVVLESWVGVICPLTRWEMALRMRAGDETYSGSFIQHWLHAILYYDAPGWVFVVAYTSFGLLVLVSWFKVPPKRRK